jgi:hypothetical protein
MEAIRLTSYTTSKLEEFRQMKQYLWFGVGVLLFATTLNANDRTNFAKLGFLQGCWKGEAEGAIVYENWGNQDGNLMLGASKTILKGQPDSFEFLSLVDGKEITYVPYVNGKSSVSFPAKHVSATSAEFSNPNHDFPKSIRYEREDDYLKISLSGDGPTIEYQLKSVSCTP